MSYSVAMLSIHTSPLDHPGSTKDAGGMNVYMCELAKALACNHINVDIYTRWTNPLTPQVIQLHPNVRVIHIQAGPLSPVHKHDLYRYTSTFAQCIAEFQRDEEKSYDIVHSHYWLSGVAGMQLAQQWGVPHIIMFHTLGRLKQQASRAQPEPQLRLDMEQRLMQSVDGIIAATAEERAQMIRYCGARPTQIKVIPCGVDLNLFVRHDRWQARQRFNFDAAQPIVLFAGRLDPFKGPDLLLRAAAMMEEDAQIVIVGGRLEGDTDLQQLQALAAELAISHRVRFLGAQPQEELPWLFSAANVTVMPSYHESFGLVAVESLACSTPVIATRAGGLTSVIRHGENGFLAPRCPGFFAERLDLLLRDANLSAQMQAAARPSVSKFSWGSVACQVYMAYDELIDESQCLVAQ